MKIALLSDIHGNSLALKAVLDDLQSRDVDLIFNLGDILYAPLDPMGTFELLQGMEMICVSGNQDRTIVEYTGKEIGVETLHYVWSELNESAIGFLKSLPFEYRHDRGIYLCHATPQKDDEYLLEKLFQTHVGVKQSNEIDEILKDVEEKIVVCGHSHLPRVLKTGLKTIINPGSVGLQAYDDNLPFFHKMENYHPNARYSILTVDNDDNLSVEQISLSYDSESTAKLAEKNNRPDWAKWIRTGMV